MHPIFLDGPEVITLSGAAAGAEGVVEREARLLVVGAYPAKDLTVTAEDLDTLVAHFSDPVPVKVEHMDTPLDPLGEVVRVWRHGDGDAAELRGCVRFPADLARFLSSRGAGKLSLGLLKAPAWQLLECSLTLSPHVPAATLLSDGERTELLRLRGERLDAQVMAWKAAGKVTPAAAPLARALLGAPAAVTLSEGASPEPVGDVFRRFLEAQPAVVPLGERAKAQAGTTLSGAGAAAADPDGDGYPESFSEEEAEVLRRLGVEPGEVAKTMAADKSGRKGKG